MTTQANEPYARAASAGISCGMRGNMAMAAIAVAAHGGTLDVGSGLPGQMLRSRIGMWLIVLGAAGELVIDKLPATPSRLLPGPLLGRAVIGALSGAIVSRGRAGSPIGGALVGSLATLASSWVFGRGRAVIGSVTGVPDPIVAIGEDGLAIVFAAIAVSSRPPGV